MKKKKEKEMKQLTFQNWGICIGILFLAKKNLLNFFIWNFCSWTVQQLGILRAGKDSVA